MPNPVILDIGANVGAFARWAKFKWPDSTIHSYEPHPNNFALLNRTVKLWCLSNVHTYNVAVFDKEGEHDFFLNGPNCGEWSLAQNSATHDKTTVKTIDAASLPDADYIKLDTEGAEPDILVRLISANKLARVSAICLEYHCSGMIAALCGLLAKQGFKMVGFKPYLEHRGLLKFVRC